MSIEWWVIEEIKSFRTAAFEEMDSSLSCTSSWYLWSVENAVMLKVFTITLRPPHFVCKFADFVELYLIIS